MTSALVTQHVRDAPQCPRVLDRVVVASLEDGTPGLDVPLDPACLIGTYGGRQQRHQFRQSVSLPTIIDGGRFDRPNDVLKSIWGSDFAACAEDVSQVLAPVLAREGA